MGELAVSRKGGGKPIGDAGQRVGGAGEMEGGAVGATVECRASVVERGGVDLLDDGAVGGAGGFGPELFRSVGDAVELRGNRGLEFVGDLSGELGGILWRQGGEAQVFGGVQQVCCVIGMTGFELLAGEVGENADVNERRTGQAAFENVDPAELFESVERMAGRGRFGRAAGWGTLGWFVFAHQDVEIRR